MKTEIGSPPVSETPTAPIQHLRDASEERFDVRKARLHAARQNAMTKVWIEAACDEVESLRGLFEQLETAQTALREIASYDGLGYQGREAARIAQRALSIPARNAA